MSWFDQLMWKYDWDNDVTYHLYNMGRFCAALGYALDNLYERLRYLTGSRWSIPSKTHMYFGLPLDQMIPGVLKGEF